MTILQNLSVRGACGKVNAHIAKYERLRNKYGNNNVNSITIRGLEIQKDSRRVFVNGKEVNLAQKEFDVLCFWPESQQSFSREEILTEYGNGCFGRCGNSDCSYWKNKGENRV